MSQSICARAIVPACRSTSGAIDLCEQASHEVQVAQAKAVARGADLIVLSVVEIAGGVRVDCCVGVRHPCETVERIDLRARQKTLRERSHEECCSGAIPAALDDVAE